MSDNSGFNKTMHIPIQHQTLQRPDLSPRFLRFRWQRRPRHAQPEICRNHIRLRSDVPREVRQSLEGMLELRLSGLDWWK